MTSIYARPGTRPTERELEVARAVIETDSREAAAARIGISRRNVTAHLANLRIRLKARNDEELFFKLRDHLAA
jgi:DNA-binding CsgD family transcriptional regulator